MLKNTLKYYLIGCGLILHVGALASAAYALNYYSLSPRQMLIKVAEKTNLDSPILLKILTPAAQYSEHQLDGKLRTQHPRILLAELSTFSAQQRTAFFQQRNQSYASKGIKAPPLPCHQTQLSSITSCWVATNDPQKFNQALNQLLDFKLETPDVTARYGNGWLLALNYDLLAMSPLMTPQHRLTIEATLETAIREYLQLLDDNSASLWHGRLSLAANAWLCAVMLTPDSEQKRALIARTQGHFLDTVKAVTITESWPEGYNYWINNRAFYFVLAASAYINGVDNSQHGEAIKRLLERVGLWHIYATRPDHQIQGYGDEGPRIDLKDETRRVIDLIASTTGNSALANYSYYLQKIHGNESYHRTYRWGFHLFNDPLLLPVNVTGALSDFEDWLPRVGFFGRNATNSLYLRSDWSQQATYLTFRAAHTFSHHGHYDAGHFTLYKGQPLAVNSSNYGDYTGPSRLNYSIRSVAKNSLLIQRPDEKVKPNRFFKDNVADGGQRITQPTGSAITSTAHWQQNLYQNKHLEGAELEHLSSTLDYTYIKTNLTPAYNNTDYDDNAAGGKVKKVKRTLLYLNREDLLLVQDHITTTNPSFRTKWLIHSINKPAVKSAQVLKGTINNGIIAATTSQALISHKNSHLAIDVLFPQDARMQLIGGSDYRYYIERDGNDSTFDGSNFSAGANDAQWFEKALWRTEVFPATQRTDTRFLIALSPGTGSARHTQATALNTSTRNNYGAIAGNTAVVFNHQSNASVNLTLPGSVNRLFLVNTPHKPRSLQMNSNPVITIKQQDGITDIVLAETLVEKSISIVL